MIIFKGLKNVPKNIKLPSNIFLAVSKGGTMNSELMKEWCSNCFSKRGNVFSRTPSFLLMDSFGSHKRDDVLDTLRKTCKTYVIVIPPKTTSFLQPMDVGVNAQFKAKLRDVWNDWLENTPPEFTKTGKKYSFMKCLIIFYDEFFNQLSTGNRKSPNYQNIVYFVSTAVKSISSDTIKRSF